MTTNERVLLAIVVVLIDLTLFVLPLTGLFAAYVLLARPPWFFAWVKQLYEGQS
jgi:hypothetical protein